MLHRFVLHALGTAAIAAQCVFSAPASTHAQEFTFPMPKPASVHVVGGTLRVEFQPSDGTSSLPKDKISFSPDGGFMWSLLTLAKVGDTINATRHFDWVITDSVLIGSLDTTISAIGESCMVAIFNYEPSYMRASSGFFSVRDSSRQSIRFSPGTRRQQHGPSRLLAVVPEAITSPSQTLHVYSADGRSLRLFDVKSTTPEYGIFISRDSESPFVR